MKKSENEGRLCFLSPKKETLKIKGNLFYNESAQSWSVIRFKKEILQEFPQLKDKRGSFGYFMVMNRTFGDMKKEISEIEKKGDVLPILLFLCKRREKI
jgi:hypothetical protein